MMKLSSQQKNILFIFFFSCCYSFYWVMIIPIQYTGDSESYLGVARMLLGLSPAGVAPIFRPPGYPILLALTGVVWPGTFVPLLIIQALFASSIPVLIYYIMIPYGASIALITAILSILSGTLIAHISQIMTEPLFTFLLFCGIALTAKMFREQHAPSSKLFYWLAIIFAIMNAVRPFAWLFFWLILALLTMRWHKKKILKPIIKSAGLFMALMLLWTTMDDILLSHGARYSPMLSMRVGADSMVENYLYDRPFREAYFSNTEKKFDSQSQPAMGQIQQQALKYITAHQNVFFDKYTKNPSELAHKMFSEPNYKYMNDIQEIMEKTTAKKQRLALYHQAAKESQTNKLTYWLQMWRSHPFILFTGPSHGAGSNDFLLAYTSLQYYLPNPRANQYESLINEKNGPATRFMFSALKKMLQNNPEFWRYTNGLFGPFTEQQTGLTQYIVSHPGQSNAWEITVMLWDCLGYERASQLLKQVAKETFEAHQEAFALRIWENILFVAAGPGLIEFEHLGPQLGRIETYDYLETAQLSQRQKAELHATQKRYESTYTAWQLPIKLSYFIFYLCKPFFLLTSIIALTTLWARKKDTFLPLTLLLIHGLCVIIYGTLFTALPRYTDPTLLLPMIVTFMAFCDLKNIIQERKNKHLIC